MNSTSELEDQFRQWLDSWIRRAERHDDREAIVKEKAKLEMAATIREKLGELYPNARGAERR